MTSLGFLLTLFDFQEQAEFLVFNFILGQTFGRPPTCLLAFNSKLGRTFRGSLHGWPFSFLPCMVDFYGSTIFFIKLGRTFHYPFKAQGGVLKVFNMISTPLGGVQEGLQGGIGWSFQSPLLSFFNMADSHHDYQGRVLVYLLKHGGVLRSLSRHRADFLLPLHGGLQEGLQHGGLWCDPQHGRSFEGFKAWRSLETWLPRRTFQASPRADFRKVSNMAEFWEASSRHRAEF